MCDSEKSFHFSESDFVYTASWQEPVNLTQFDNSINSYWNYAMTNEYFKSKLNLNKKDQLKGKFKMIAQLNIERGLTKRKAQNIQNMDTPFNPDAFNFTVISDREIIFEMINDQADEKQGKDQLAINDSPLAQSHCLLLPQVDKKLPQVLTLHAAKLALHTLLLSGTPSFRLGFNSLCGYASVNHLHLHTFLIPQKMVLETIPLTHLAGPCYYVDQYAVKGFAFEREISCAEDITAISRDTYKLARFLQDKKIAHNINFTRSGDTYEEDKRAKVRVFVWAREYNGVRSTEGFSPALCEFFGLLEFKDEEIFHSMATEESVCEVLEKLTSSCFENIRSSVYELFNQNNT